MVRLHPFPVVTCTQALGPQPLEEIMHVIDHNPGMRIVNIDQLPRGTGAKYLEVFEDDRHDVLVAVVWRRTKPRALQAGRHLIRFY